MHIIPNFGQIKINKCFEVRNIKIKSLGKIIWIKREENYIEA